MNEQELSNNEILVLRLLYSKQLESDTIPSIFFGKEEKERLTDLALLDLDLDKKYRLTDKAIKLIEDGGYIIKYPLSTEEGTVLNYKEVLNQMSPKAARALGLSIVNTEFYKKWGKHNNLTLLNLLQDTISYYRSFDHPVSKIEQYQEDVKTSQSNCDRAIHSEFQKIENFLLIKPIKLGVDSNGKKMKLVKILSKNKAEVIIGDSKESIIININDSELILTSNDKTNIVRQYYLSKSRQPSPSNKDGIVE